MSWSFFLRLLIIVVLFTIFVNICAWPSFNNYLNAGVIIEKTSVRRENKDTPAITFCAMDNDTNVGWKNKISVKVELGMTWVDLYCNSSNKVKDAVACLDDVTYNLTETIRNTEVDECDFVNCIDTANDLWMYDVTEAYTRGLFKGASQLSIQIVTQCLGHINYFRIQHLLLRPSYNVQSGQ
jgi:hypothetical protein